MNKWTINGETVSYDFENKYSLRITKEKNGISIKTVDLTPPRGRTEIIYCKRISDRQLGFKF